MRFLGRLVGWGLIFALGVAAGGWLFAGTRWRPFLPTHATGHKLDREELLGLVGSVVVRRTPGLLPDVLLETDRSVAFLSPIPEARTDIVIVPKRDIKDIGDLRKGDEPYLVDAIAVAGRLARDRGMENWSFYTRGPGEQSVRYLHFHLASNEPVSKDRGAQP